jgi:hypothetical protein
MDTIELRIKDGPRKPDLLWAVAYPDRHIHVHFDGDADAVAAHVDTMKEMGDGTQLVLKGHLTSGQFKGWPFRAIYELGDHTGVLHAHDESSA